MQTRNVEELSGRLAAAAVRLTRWLRAVDPAPTLTGAQASALAVVVHSGGIRPSELAALEEVKRPTVARTIAELVGLGFVCRQGDADDGRSVVVRATPAGVRVLLEGHARRVKPLARAVQRLAPGDLERLGGAVELLESLLAAEIGAPGELQPESSGRPRPTSARAPAGPSRRSRRPSRS